jgi:hypothetical protein
MIGTGFSFDSEFIVEKDGGDVIFRGGEIIFSSKRRDSTPLPLAVPTAMILVIADQMYADDEIIRLSEADSDVEIIDVDNTGSLEEDLTKAEETYGEMIYFVTPRGKLTNVERPFMKVSLVLSSRTLDADEMVSRLDEDMTEDFQLLSLPGMEQPGINTGKSQIPGEVMDDIVNQVGGDETLSYIGMYKGRLRDR